MYIECVNFLDAALEDAENFCRNPGADENATWCYTIDHDVRWEFCDIPVCLGLLEVQKPQLLHVCVHIILLIRIFQIVCNMLMAEDMLEPWL